MWTTRAMKVKTVAVLALTQIAATQAAPNAAVVRYQIKRGDTLYALARDYCASPGSAMVLERLNHIADPRRISTGRILLIPKSMLRVEIATAHVVAVRGNVRIVRGSQAMPIGTGGRVDEGDIIATGVNSFITLGLADGTSVSLPSQSRLRLARLRRVLLTNTIDRDFSLMAGQLDSTVHPLSKSGGKFRFTTPSSVSTVRGTQLRVAYDPGTKRARTEVLEGQVEVASPEGGAGRMLSAGFGAIGQAGVIHNVHPLLPAPGLIRPDRDQDDPQLHFTVTPVRDAASYRIEIAADAGFLEVVADMQSGETGSLPAVDDGNWFVRISAIDSNGLQGFGKIYSFRRRLNATDLSSAVHRDNARGVYLFRWRTAGNGRFQYRFQLFSNSDPDHAIVDEPGLTGQDFALTKLSPGDYRWRVGTIQFVDGQVYEKWSANQEFTVSKK